MKLLCDENIEHSLVNHLRTIEFDVRWIREDSPGITDEKVLLKAQQERRLLITADLDFGVLVHKQSKEHAGVVVLRLAELSIQDKSEIVGKVLKKYQDKLMDSFTVVKSDSIRIR